MADKCPECPDEGLPGWMGTFADMMTLLFAFFVLMFSMATMDPVKMAAFSEAEADFIFQPEGIVLRKASAIGASLGVSMHTRKPRTRPWPTC